jgi:protein O-mannosyl-transferase
MGLQAKNCSDKGPVCGYCGPHMLAPCKEGRDSSRVTGAPKGRWRVGLGALALVALTLAVYRPLLPGGFLMDDRRLVETDNPLVNGTAGLRSIWFQSDFPLSTVSFWAEWRAFGQSPAGYHAVNMALHACGALMLWALLARLKIPGAWLAGAIFAVHPVCAATVGRMAELKNTLSLPFFLLSFWLYLRYESDSRRRALWLACSLAAFTLALLAKTSTVMLPLLLLACAAWQRGRLAWQDWLRTSPFFALAAGFGWMSVWFQKHQALADAALVPRSFWERLALAGRVFWFYLGKALWPAHLNLVYPPWKTDPASPAAYVPDLLCCAAALVCWRFRRSWGRHVLFGLGCFALALFPALGFFDAQYLTRWQVSDHLQYLPLIAPVALAAAGLACLPGAAFSRGAAAGVVVLLAVLTFERARVFSTEEGLFRDTLAGNPAAWGIQNDLGAVLAARGDQAEAAEHFQAALRFNPDYPDARANLGRILQQQGWIEEAQSNFLAALKVQPLNPQANAGLGAILAQQGKIHEAMRCLQTALLAKPDFRTRLDYVALLHETGDFREAVAQLRQALRARPDSVEALNNLAWLLATCPDPAVRNGAEAVDYAERASRLPAPAGMCVPGTLAAAYAEAGRFKEAVATAEKAIETETAAGDSRFAEINRQLLAFYRAGRAWHEPPPRKENPFSVDGN